MKRYYYELMDEDYNSYEAAIPDGRIKARAIAQAKRAMRDLGIRRALLVVNSMRTSNILDIITEIGRAHRLNSSHNALSRMPSSA